jgi:hypothetical protein
MIEEVRDYFICSRDQIAQKAGNAFWDSVRKS